MHRCMLISEILFQIFSELDGHVYDTRMRFPTRIRHREGQALRTLAGLARTCRTFKEPALDVLWREITDLFVLIKYLMPDEFLRYDEDSRELFLQHEPGPDVWKLLDPYVARIRAIGIPPPSGVIARVLDAETVLRPLERHLSQIAADRDVLFPKLEHVVYHAVWGHELHSRLLLHPHLKMLQLPLGMYTSQWELTPLEEEHIIVTIERSIRTLRAHVPHALRRMQDLRALWVTSSLLYQPTFAHLGSLPTPLTDFALEGSWTITVWHPPRAVEGPRAFAALRALSVTTGDADIPHFIAHIAPECLEAVNVHWGSLYSDATSAGEDFWGVLAALSYLPHIKHLSVALDEIMERRMEKAAEGDSAGLMRASRRLKALPDSGAWCLSPVLFCTALRTLEIVTDIAFQVDERFLMDLADKLPFLESLCLTPLLRGPFPLAYSQDDSGRQVLNIPALNGLLPFVQRCWRLTTLRLVVCGTLAERLTYVRVAPGRGVTPVRYPSCLRTLELWTTALNPSIPDEMFVAGFHRVFPYLEDLLVVVAKHPEEHWGGAPMTRSEACVRWERVVGTVSRSFARWPDRGGGLRWEVI